VKLLLYSYHGKCSITVIDKQFNRRLPKRNVPVGHDEELDRGRKGSNLEQTRCYSAHPSVIYAVRRTAYLWARIFIFRQVLLDVGLV